MADSVEGLILHAASDQLVEIASDVDPALGAVVELGVYALSDLSPSLKSAQSAAPDATFLVVQQVIDGATKDTVYKISARQHLDVALNGQFVETITPHEVTVDVAPDTDSTIVVTVDHPDNSVFRSGDFTTSDLPFDLDSGESHASSGQAEVVKQTSWSYGGPQLVTGNGTMVSMWSGSDLPLLANCVSLPASSWSPTIIRGDNWGDDWTKNGTSWCIHTTGNRYGVMEVINQDYTFSYVIWKNPGDK